MSDMSDYAGLMLLASAIALIVGMVTLVTQRKWAVVARYFLALGVFIGLWSAADKVENPDLRMWFLMPLIFLIPVWLMSGFLLYKASEGKGFFEPEPSLAWDIPPRALKRGIAVVCILWGIGCFSYGVFNSSSIADSPWPVIITYAPFAYGINVLRPRR